MIPLRDKALIAAILIAIFGVFGYLAMILAGHNDVSKHTADGRLILADLPADPAAANAKFREKIFAEFPLSTPEETMVKVLTRRGFVSDGWFGKRMTFRWLLGGGGRSPCDFTASVSWETDDQARIQKIDARFLRTPDCVLGL